MCRRPRPAACRARSGRARASAPRPSRTWARPASATARRSPVGATPAVATPAGATPAGGATRAARPAAAPVSVPRLTPPGAARAVRGAVPAATAPLRSKAPRPRPRRSASRLPPRVGRASRVAAVVVVGPTAAAVPSPPPEPTVLVRKAHLTPAPFRGPRRPPLRVWIWTAATLALVVVAALLWRGSDAAATESTTAAPARVPSRTPAHAVSLAWERGGDPLPGDVVEQGRVILGSAHGVAAVDPVSGDESWHYTRSNALLCGVTATNGVVVAVFRTEDRCDEAVALDAGTGVRTWTRNVLFRSDAILKSTDQIVLAISKTGVVTLDPTGDNIRWRYDLPKGCVIDDAEVGSAGVAVLQTCDRSTTAQLRLLDGFTGKGHWNHDVTVPRGSTVRLLGADQLIGLVVGDQVQALSADSGSVRHPIPPAGDGQPQELS